MANGESRIGEEASGALDRSPLAARHSPFVTGLRLRCPQCSQGEVFSRYLRFRERCRVCGADFSVADAGDGPAVFVILFVGAIVAPLLFVLQFVLDLPAWLALTLTMLAAVALSLALLPPFKSVLFSLQWAHKAREARPEDME